MTADLSGMSRITVVTGHYGSGKTEFSVSLVAAFLSCDNAVYGKTAIVDLDIANPYFRSREQRGMLEKIGAGVYGSAYKTEITAELPALGADIRKPLEDKNCRVVIDAGGDASGALILNQFKKYLTDNVETTVLAVINANRPETRDITGALRHIAAIEAATGLRVTGLVNNTHLLMETTVSDILNGNRLCKEICAETGKELIYDCYPGKILSKNDLPPELHKRLMPLGLYMRPDWLDR